MPAGAFYKTTSDPSTLLDLPRVTASASNTAASGTVDELQLKRVRLRTTRGRRNSAHARDTASSFSTTAPARPSRCRYAARLFDTTSIIRAVPCRSSTVGGQFRRHEEATADNRKTRSPAAKSAIKTSFGGRHRSRSRTTPSPRADQSRTVSYRPCHRRKGLPTPRAYPAPRQKKKAQTVTIKIKKKVNESLVSRHPPTSPARAYKRAKLTTVRVQAILYLSSHNNNFCVVPRVDRTRHYT